MLAQKNPLKCLPIAAGVVACRIVIDKEFRKAILFDKLDILRSGVEDALYKKDTTRDALEGLRDLTRKITKNIWP